MTITFGLCFLEIVFRYSKITSKCFDFFVFYSKIMAAFYFLADYSIYFCLRLIVTKKVKFWKSRQRYEIQCNIFDVQHKSIYLDSKIFCGSVPNFYSKIEIAIPNIENIYYWTEMRFHKIWSSHNKINQKIPIHNK